MHFEEDFAKFSIYIYAYVDRILLYLLYVFGEFLCCLFYPAPMQKVLRLHFDFDAGSTILYKRRSAMILQSCICESTDSKVLSLRKPLKSHAKARQWSMPTEYHL
jgi:hypothetical protein